MKKTFKSSHPKLLKEWNHKKNDTPPEKYSPVSGKKVWWICEKNHEWEALISNRVNGRNCPYCSGRKVGNDNNLLFLNPKLSSEWDFKKNKLKPNEVTPFSHHKIWWICKKNIKHNYIASVLHRSGGTGCPYCAGHKINSTNSLKTLFPEISNEWDYSKNKNLLPNNIGKGSDKVVWWKCTIDKSHVYKASVQSRTGKKTGCPYCAGKKINQSNNLKTLYPSVAKEWHPTKNKNLRPENFTAGSETKIWWLCKNKHEWQAQIYSRTKLKTYCPYCKNRRVNKDNSLASLYPKIVKEWDFDKNKKHPNEYVYGSHSKVWWKCKFGHEWQAIIFSRTIKKTNCPKCSPQTSKPELLIFSEIKSIFEGCKHRHKIKGQEVDLFLEELNIGIEYDGYYFHKDRLEKDRNKNDILKNDLFRLIRFRESPLKKISKLDQIVKEQIKKTDIDNLLKTLEKYSSNKTKAKINKYLKEKNFVNEKHFKEILSKLPAPIFENSLAFKHPEIIKTWDYEKNFPLVPELFKPHSHHKVHWICKNKHSWKTQIRTRTQGSSCPSCRAK